MKKVQFVMVGMILMAVAIATTSCMSCGEMNISFSGKHVTENRQLKDFEEIEINGSPTVYYTQGTTYSVEVKGPEDLVKNILTEKDGKTLVIRNKGKFGIVNIQMGGEDELAVYVTSPDLIGVRLNGSGDFISSQRIDTDNMNVVLRGSGDIEISDLICDRCQLELIGSGDMDVKRLEAREASASVTGSGDMKLALFNVLTTSLLLKGSGDLDAHFAEGCQRVESELHGSGEIELSGQVHQFNKHKSGSGEIDTDRLKVN